MKIELKEKSLYANFYRKSYGLYDNDELPQSICNYSWALLWAIIWLPLSWWSYMWAAIPFLKIKNQGHYLWQRCFAGFFSYVGTGLLCGLTLYCIENPIKLFEGLKILGWMILGLIGIVILAWICYGVIPELKNKIKKGEGYKIANSTWYSWKNKVCPKITWKKTD